MYFSTFAYLQNKKHNIYPFKKCGKIIKKGEDYDRKRTCSGI